MVGLKDKLKVMFMMENWFLEFSIFLGELCLFVLPFSAMCFMGPHSMSIVTNVTVLCSI